MKRLGLLGLVLFPLLGWGQHTHVSTPVKEDSIVHIQDFFGKGHIGGHVRNFFMATVNQGELKDYWTNATGASIDYTSATWKGLQVGIKGILTFQTFSSDLDRKDETAGSCAKWEKEMYDVTRPDEYKDLDRLEELFVHYGNDHRAVKIGKIDLDQGPLLLRRDGRMKPFVYRGIWSEFQAGSRHHITAGLLDKVSPRGMTEWFAMNEAIGLIDGGHQPNGQDVQYHEAAHTRGLGVLGYNRKEEEYHFQVWNYALDRISNTLWTQFELEKKRLSLGIQYVNQFPLKAQRDLEYDARYMQPTEVAHVLSAQAGFKHHRWKYGLAYLYNHDQGRFLFPKEMGREDFFVSQAFSWINGLGKTNVFQFRTQYHSETRRWLVDHHLSYWDVPGRNQAKWNKYGMSDYFQSTLQIGYQPGQILEGVELKLNYVARYSNDKDIPLEDQFYRTNLHHFDLITNINF